MITFIFNLFDTIGRFIPNWITILSSRGTTYLCMLRAISIISICLIGYGVFNEFFVHDWWIIINLIIFAITNGLGTSLSMMHGVNEADENAKDDVGELMIFYMTSGICIGALLAQIIFANLF